MWMTSLTKRAPAKLNLFLNVTGRRSDGFHEIDSLFGFCGLHDSLWVSAGPLAFRKLREPALASIVGPFAGEIEPGPGNLVMKAARLIQSEAGIREAAYILLDKRVPVAAGLGGGSSDAAATLLALNRVWRLDWPPEQLEALASQLGADVPACIRLRPVYARGIGERLTDAPPLPSCGVLLVNPRVATSTPSVFKSFRELNPVIDRPEFPALPEEFPDLAALVAAIEPRGNDLLQSALTVTPAIADVLEALRSLSGVAYASLSGSGATCFALFETVPAARIAQGSIMWRRPDWWTWSGGWFRP
jgi:4-diphosphocytidyl-2-C-methyl-D-erythritol kinase